MRWLNPAHLYIVLSIPLMYLIEVTQFILNTSICFFVDDKCPTYPPLTLGASRTTDCRPIRSILFVLDTSGSINKKDFNMMKMAIGKLVPFMCGKIQVAVMTFGSQLKNEFCFNCYNNNQRSELIDAINNIQYRGGWTHTGEAARCAYHEYLTPSCGLHPVANCIDVVFITDGQSNGALSACREANCLRNHLVSHHVLQVYAIGIGSGVNEGEIDCIAGSDEDSIFSIKSFAEFEKQVDDTVRKLFNSASHSCVDNFRDAQLGKNPL